MTGMPAGGAGTLPATLVGEEDIPAAGRAAAAGAGVDGFEQPAGNTTQPPSAHRTIRTHLTPLIGAASPADTG